MLRVFGVIPEDDGVGFPVTGTGTADEVSLVGTDTVFDTDF